MSQEFCVNTVVSKLVKDYVQQPDYSAIRDEIDAHTEGFCLIRQRLEDPDTQVLRPLGKLAKVLFTNSETVIVQDLELTCGHTRYNVRQIALPDWQKWLKEWVDEGGFYYDVCVDIWQDGMRMYGAEV